MPLIESHEDSMCTSDIIRRWKRALGFTVIDATLAIDTIKSDVDISVMRREFSERSPEIYQNPFPLTGTRTAPFGGKSLPLSLKPTKQSVAPSSSIYCQS
jgi:hypothetical protein